VNYKGHEYEVEFCNPKDDWRDEAGKFRVASAINCDGYFNTYAQAITAAKAAIDDFVEATPKTKDEWIDAMRSCMVWSGHEHCDLDETMVWGLLQKASKYLPKEGAEK
jgi:hypothetical protein